MEITKVLKHFIRRGANTFGNIVYIYSHTRFKCASGGNISFKPVHMLTDVWF